MLRLGGLDRSVFLSARLSSSSPRRTKRAWVALGLAFAGVGACSKDDGDDAVRYDPAVLEILGAQNTAGEEFDREDSTIVLACDPRLTFHVGPQDVTPGLLKNWNLRPPTTCPEDSQCGYLRYRLLDDAGKTLLESDQSSIAPVLDLSTLELGEIARFVALLMDGATTEPYLQDGVQISDSWDIRVESGSVACEDLGSGGSASGTGGSDSTGGNDGFGGEHLGGMGGLGGATDE